ncbi:hypothetical protein B0T17DRAFT_544270 [Bombardia bombarda]|uniref:WRKY domain-containing protein n=1 Tax=Bombardia bombarda TaxID=252184 RepID=A0AA39T2E5_9PEZI|nr:hypothetical protein B0T17DRAFT_544270 [Bombardia bombarda]
MSTISPPLAAAAEASDSIQNLQLRLFPTFQDLIQAVNDLTESLGFRVVNLAASNPGPDGSFRRRDLICGRRWSEYASLRDDGGGGGLKTRRLKYIKTRQFRCKWRARACLRKCAGAWVFIMMETSHNHPPGLKRAESEVTAANPWRALMPKPQQPHADIAADSASQVRAASPGPPTPIPEPRSLADIASHGLALLSGLQPYADSASQEVRAGPTPLPGRP